MNSDRLIKKCIGKDALAWNEFVRLYEGLVCRSVRNKLSGINVYLLQSEMNDIVQEIFIMLWEKDKLSTLRDVKHLKRWLVKVSVNSTISYCRRIFKITSKTRSLDKGLADDNPHTLTSIIPCNKFNASRLIEKMEVQETLEKEMSRLTRRQRQALRLNVYECKKQKDIARIMSIPAGSVSTLISRAKRQVCKAVENCYS